MIHPIWKDYYADLGGDSSAQYRIVCNDSVIYTGRAFKRPGHDAILVRINDICADYLQNTLPELLDREFSEVALPVTFKVQHFAGSVWRDVTEVRFVNDWSYDYAHDPETDGVAFPINGRVQSNQWVVWSGLDVDLVDAKIIFKDGSQSSVYIPVSLSNDFDADFNSDFSKSVRAAASGTAVFRPSEWGDLAAMRINGVDYEVIDGCNRYALYYVNSYGGWDCLLVEGGSKEVDNLARKTREVEYDNRNVQNRGRVNYVTEVDKTITLHTSWMSDESAARMHNLLNSTDVYLCDILKDEMIPVILTNTATEYKTYKNNGGKLVNYTIEVEFANQRVRR